MKLAHALVLLFVLIPCCASARQPAAAGNCTHKDPSSRPDCPAAIAFLARLQTAVRSNNHDAVAALVRYPLLTPKNGRVYRIRSRAQLLANFNRVFRPDIRKAILNAGPDDVWGNGQGFMIGQGVIWFDGIPPQGTYKLITVNSAVVPTAPAQ
jgi:hypothetical protein